MSPAAARWLRRAGVVVLGLVLLAGAALWFGLSQADRKMQRKVEVAVQPVALRPLTDTVALERGRYLYASRGCVDCHGANGGGRTFIDDPNGLRVAGPHISPGPGSVTAGYRPEDWVRVIRHGVHPIGRPLMIMPSEDYNRFTDDDLASLVAHIRSLPPTEGGAAVLDLPLPVRALYGFGLIQDAAAKIDHTRPPAAPVPEGVSVQHGAYVANMCLGCHGAQLAGGKIPGGPPDWPAASRLAPGEGTVMARYPDAESMMRLFKTGQRPDGTPVRVMPFESLREISEIDMRALHLYLRQLPPPAKG
ncbi:c-type cytochrome [Variovorax arabinosiphilus]|uniref:c-type cytochrome n=1 Tax=Variovorax arabinosiphilus TaxID=3053498 RepID=UPI002576061E|nr:MULTISPECIES: cytochrome c [unclassified Variovorax]MDM0121575.1 cytochrome c [Variovorax sp. J2L1-78]MDM0130636.1 cytochrome c [Variovorax sp. J2L1-63]MDM0234338.1 cytochrome c [Variovorax sp. J2R1-6]